MTVKNEKVNKLSKSFCDFALSSLTLIFVFCIVILIFDFCTFNYAYAARFGISIPSNNLGLVGWWTFDGPDMISNIADKSGQGNNGYMLGFTSTSSAVVPGKIGQALQFDGGVNDRIIMPSNTASVSGAITVSVWVKVKTVEINEILIMRGSSPTLESLLQYAMMGYPNDDLAFRISNGTSFITVDTNGALIKDTWLHIVGIYDGSENLYLYKDGVQVDTSYSAGFSINTSEAAEFDIGATDTGSAPFDGSLDDVRIYNRALSAGEIKVLYNQGAGTKLASSPRQNPDDSFSQGLIGHWTFDGPDVNWSTGAVTDKSGQGNTGYVVNMSTTTSVAKGKLGQALKFDGVNDQVNAGSASSIDNKSGSSTISAWIYARSYGEAANSLIVCKEYNGSGWYFVLDSTFKAVKYYNSMTSGSSYFVSSENSYPPSYFNQWHHVVAVWNGSVTATEGKIYIDGVESSPHRIDDNGGGGPVEDSDYNLYIGNNHFTSASFDGYIDDVRFYNRMLSADEIRRLYNQTAGEKMAATPKGVAAQGLNAGLVGHWTFDGPDVNWSTGAVTDKSGNGYTTYVQGLSTSTSVTKGKFGQAFDFKNENGAVMMGNLNAIENLESFSVSAWVKSSVPSKSETDWIVAQDGAGDNTFNLSWDNGENISFAVRDSSDVAYSAIYTNGINDTQWHHVVGVLDGAADTVTVYVDLVAGGIVPTFTDVTNESTNLFSISGRTTTFPGIIDDVRVWNRALSINEIRQLYNLGR